MSTVQDLRRALGEEMARLQPNPGLEARILEQALHAPSPGELVRPGRPRSARSRRREPVKAPRLLALVAALLVIAAIATLIGVGILHPSGPTPAKPGPGPNGQLVIGDGHSLFAFDPVTGQRHAILSAPADVAVSDAAYSPDGTRLAYLRAPGGGIDEPTLWFLSTASGATRLLTTCHAPGCGRFSHLSWSPDGSRLVFSDSDGRGGLQLYLVRADGTDRTQLTRFPAGQFATQPSWSPDGARIAFSLSTQPIGQQSDCGYDCETLAPPTNLDVINVDGSGLAVLLANVRQQNGFGNLDPAWSPDGSRIAYALTLPLTGPLSARYQLWLMNPDGSHPTKIFDEWEYYDAGGPAWSPDGARIAIVMRDVPRSNYELWVMDADGSHRRSLGFVYESNALAIPYGAHAGDRPAWQPKP